MGISAKFRGLGEGQRSLYRLCILRRRRWLQTNQKHIGPIFMWNLITRNLLDCKRKMKTKILYPSCTSNVSLSTKVIIVNFNNAQNKNINKWILLNWHRITEHSITGTMYIYKHLSKCCMLQNYNAIQYLTLSQVIIYRNHPFIPKYYLQCLHCISKDNLLFFY